MRFYNQKIKYLYIFLYKNFVDIRKEKKYLGNSVLDIGINEHYIDTKYMSDYGNMPFAKDLHP